MSMKNDPRVGHAPSTTDEAISWLNRAANGEPGMHLVSLRESVRAVSREIDAIKKARDDHFALRLLAEVERDRLRERLDQFDAHGFPNVAAALDRVNAAEAERDRLRERVAELEEDLIDIPDVAK